MNLSKDLLRIAAANSYKKILSHLIKKISDLIGCHITNLHECSLNQLEVSYVEQHLIKVLENINKIDIEKLINEVQQT